MLQLILARVWWERGRVSVEECREFGIDPNGGFLWHMVAIINVATTLDTLGAKAVWLIWFRDLERTINGIEVMNTILPLSSLASDSRRISHRQA